MTCEQKPKLPSADLLSRLVRQESDWRMNVCAYWCCPVHRLSWGCRSPSPSPPWSPRSPAVTSCPRGWCRWSSPHSPATSACRHSDAQHCSLPWGRNNTVVLLSTDLSRHSCLQRFVFAQLDSKKTSLCASVRTSSSKLMTVSVITLGCTVSFITHVLSMISHWILL